MAEYYSIAYMYHNFFIHLSVYGYLGCFHVLAIVNSAEMNNGIHVSFSITVSSKYMQRSAIAQSSFHISLLFVSDILHFYGLQHARSPCPPLTPRAFSNSCLSSRWCHPIISSSVIPFSSSLQSFPASGSFPMSQVLKVLDLKLQHQSFQWIFRTDFL